MLPRSSSLKYTQLPFPSLSFKVFCIYVFLLGRSKEESSFRHPRTSLMSLDYGFPLSGINEALCGIAYWFLFSGVSMPTDGCHCFSPLLIPRECLESTGCPLHAWLFYLVVSQTSLHMCTIFFINYIHIHFRIINKIKLISI